MGKKYWSAAWSIYRGQGEAETDEQGRVLKNEPKPRLREGERGGGRLDFMGGGGCLISLGPGPNLGFKWGSPFHLESRLPWVVVVVVGGQPWSPEI